MGALLRSTTTAGSFTDTAATAAAAAVTSGFASTETNDLLERIAVFFEVDLPSEDLSDETACKLVELRKLLDQHLKATAYNSEGAREIKKLQSTNGDCVDDSVVDDGEAIYEEIADLTEQEVALKLEDERIANSQRSHEPLPPLPKEFLEQTLSPGFDEENHYVEANPVTKDQLKSYNRSKINILKKTISRPFLDRTRRSSVFDGTIAGITGQLRIQNKTEDKWKKKQCVVTSQVMQIYGKDKKLERIIHLGACELESYSSGHKGPFVFSLTREGKEPTMFRASSPEDMGYWVRRLVHVMKLKPREADEEEEEEVEEEHLYANVDNEVFHVGEERKESLLQDGEYVNMQLCEESSPLRSVSSVDSVRVKENLYSWSPDDLSKKKQKKRKREEIEKENKLKTQLVIKKNKIEASLKVLQIKELQLEKYLEASIDHQSPATEQLVENIRLTLGNIEHLQMKRERIDQKLVKLFESDLRGYSNDHPISISSDDDQEEQQEQKEQQEKQEQQEQQQRQQQQHHHHQQQQHHHHHQVDPRSESIYSDPETSITDEEVKVKHWRDKATRKARRDGTLDRKRALSASSLYELQQEVASVELETIKKGNVKKLLMKFEQLDHHPPMKTHGKPAR